MEKYFEILRVIVQLQTLKSMRLRKTLVFLVFFSSNRLNANQSSNVTEPFEKIENKNGSSIDR